MINDHRPAYSYLSSFINTHTAQKGEIGLEEKYFRNRAGDLSFGYLFLNYCKMIITPWAS